MINLHWAIHNHQPVGNFDFIFERAFNQAYGPFLDVLGSHPKIRMSMHFSGILLDWLEAKRPQYLAGLRGLVERGQLEILGGAFYEPILPVISDSHKIGQLKKLSESVRRLFGTAPKGIWLAERVWEPTLVKPISEAGLEYVLLDGSHFKMVGKTDADMDGYFMSEDNGHTLKLFPIHDVVRDYIPFRSVDEVADTLLALDKGGDVQVVFGDDGEKFGDWPGTHHHVYTDRWLHRFFEKVEGLSDRIRVVPVEAGLKPEKNLGLVYLPPASYQEMMVWAQDAHDIGKFRHAQKTIAQAEGNDSLKFLRGTFWRNFFNKYSESNQMHKQGLRLARIYDRLQGTLPAKVKNEAQDHIWQSECNCGYWHGVFGGLYLPHLRFALYRHLIQAQRLLDVGLFAAKEDPLWEVLDWNCDGKPEYTLNSREVYLSITHQGEIDQFWLKDTGINLSDTLTRRYEAYHELIGGKGEAGTKLENSLGEKEANLRGYLIYDRRKRRSLSDVFMKPGASFKEYASQDYPAALAFEAKETVLERRPKETAVRVLGIARTPDGTVIGVEKEIVLAKGSPDLRVEWKFTNPVTNSGKPPVEFRFGTEALFCLLAGNAHDRYIEWDAPASGAKAAGEPHRDILASRGEMPGASRVTVTDEWLRLRCEAKFPGAGRAWRDAIETVSQSEGGYERVYQGTVLIPVWDQKLAPGAEGAAVLSIQFAEGA
ncbi:MAG TPA: alpha-amylase/4-alpha-glucanotransferase domain-containing protein [Fibrobacteria bacterium]|nr:alpha-amylase/4-alpha-glucanotransferase domain-containing protein [Fibrobacteria bacterium]